MRSKGCCVTILRTRSWSATSGLVTTKSFIRLRFDKGKSLVFPQEKLTKRIQRYIIKTILNVWCNAGHPKGDFLNSHLRLKKSVNMFWINFALYFFFYQFGGPGRGVNDHTDPQNRVSRVEIICTAF